jgi:glutamate 5-kinase
MRSKVIAAEMAGSGGVVTCIARAAEPGIVRRVIAGDRIGTRIAAHIRQGSAFKLWLRHAKPSVGTIHVDAGAYAAIVERGASLLPVGIVAVDGDFHVGDAVDVAGPSGEPFAKGIVEHSGSELTRLIKRRDAARGALETIHRDQLVLLAATPVA